MCSSDLVPFVRARAGQGEPVPLWVVRGRGRFGRQVAVGAVQEAQRNGLETVERRNGDGPLLEGVPDAWDLFSAGRFEDDVAIVDEARSAARPPRVICSVAAGVRDFAGAVADAEGIYGVAQWYPGRSGQPELGPSEDEFVAAYRSRVGVVPDYPAVQAAAAAVLATHCLERAASVDPATLWAAAAGLETTTLLGEFRIDGSTGAQTKHAPLLVQWRGDSLQLAA